MGCIDKKYRFGWKYCFELDNISIPEGVTRIEGSAFASCSSLKSITFPSTLEFIGGWTFYWCPLVNVVLPNKIKTIEDEAFGTCYELESIVLPKSITYIGERVIPSTMYGEYNVLVYVEKDSYAETYLKSIGCDYEYINN